MSDVPFSNLLVYLDGSEGSLNALMYGIMLAKSTGARLHALYVVNTKALSDLVKSHVFIDQEKEDYLTDLRDDSQRHVRHAKKLAATKDLDVEAMVAEGSPHLEVLNYVKDNSIDLLLLGSINVIRSRRDELTSENDRILRTAQCPVLVVKDDDDIWDKFEEMPI